MEVKGTLSENQYSFRAERGTMKAIGQLLKEMMDAKRDRLHVLVATLDIKTVLMQSGTPK